MEGTEDLGARVLIVDDERCIRDVYSAMFKSWGCEIVCADDGDTGLVEFVKDKFDLVISDLRMPRLDGIGLTRKIREQEKKRAEEQKQEDYSPTPILIVTGFANERQKEAYAAGCNEFLFKPIAMKTFKEKLDRYYHHPN